MQKGTVLKMKKLLSLSLALVLVLGLFTACGAPTMSDNKAVFDSAVSAPEADYSYGWALDEDVAEDAIEEPYYPEKGNSASAEADNVPATERKIIKNKDLTVQTLEYDKFVSELSQKVTFFGGYIENSTQNGSSITYTRLRSATYRIRIPAEHFDEFTNLVGELGTVTYAYEYMDDITSQYIDVEARLSALRAERDSFMKLMDRAETVEEILKIQSYLTDVNYQIESYTARLNSYKSLVSYSTVTINVNEVERVTTSHVKKGVFERISENLSDNLYDIGEGFKDLFVGFVSALPYLVIFAVIGAIGLLIVNAFLKKSKKTAKTPEKPEEKR